VAITPPISANILEGITRRSMMQLLSEELGGEGVERQIDRTDVYLADEIFMCGTGVQIAAVTRIEHREVGDATRGPISSEVRDLYVKVVAGKVEKYREWLSPVYIKDRV
jgi:branched-chain amino acid aminotransferase